MRSMNARLLPLLLLAGLFLAPLAPDAISDDEAAQPETVVVQRRAFRETLSLSGAFVPTGAVEIAYRPKVYGGALEIVEAAGPGPVVAGQVLVKFDDEAMQRDLRSRERDLFSARAKLQKQKAEFKQKQVHTRLGRERSARNLARAELNLKLFYEVHKPTRIARAVYNLEGTANRIKDAEEELAQLLKMYEADDLTEETEAIVIARSRRSLARQHRSFEWAKQAHELFLEVTLPREVEDHEANIAKQRADFQAYEVASEADLRRAELDLDRAQTSYDRSEELLQLLKADRDALRLRAPVDGYAVPGAFTGTAWGDIAGARRALRPGASVKKRQVLFTIVVPGQVAVAAVVGESDVLDVKVGQTVTVRAGIQSQKPLDAVVDEVLRVGKGGKYAVAVDLKETLPVLLPGMGCKLSIVTRVEENALVLPKGAIGKRDGVGHVVFVQADGKVEMRKVDVGARSGDQVEILSGVAEGDTVLKTPPAEKK